jgi:hypothetical protein
VTMKNCFFWDVRGVALVITDVSEELSASIIRVARIGELGTMLAVTSNERTLRLLVTANVRSTTILVTLIMKALTSSRMSFLTRATRRTCQKTPLFRKEG